MWRKRSLFRNLRIKVGDCGTEETFEKAARKTGTMAGRSGSIQPQTECTDDNIDALIFLYYVIFIHKLDIIRKEYVVWSQIDSAAILPNIIKICQHLTE